MRRPRQSATVRLAAMAAGFGTLCLACPTSVGRVDGGAAAADVHGVERAAIDAGQVDAPSAGDVARLDVGREDRGPAELQPVDSGSDARPEDGALGEAGARDGPCPEVRSEDAPAEDSAAGDRRTLTVVTLNTHSFQEGADSLAKLEAIGAGLAALQADLVGLNEVMSGTFWAYDHGGDQHDGSAIIRTALEAASGATWFAASHGFAHWSTGELMSNVVLSRHPIVEHASRPLTTTDAWPGPAEQRNVVYARVQVPSLGPVNLFVTHAWGWDSVDTAVQIAEVKAYMAEMFRGDEALDLLVGDLNSPSTSVAYRTWLDSAPFALIDTYAAANPGGFADPTTVGGAHRIDYVLAGAGWPLSEDPARSSSWRSFDGVAHAGLTLPVVSDHVAVVTRFWLD